MSNESKDIITRVCVYSDRAMITREVELKEADGEKVYSFMDLTPHLLRDSIRVKGAGEMVLLDNNLRDIVLRDTNIEELNEIEKERRRIQREIKIQSREIEKLNSLLAYLSNLTFSDAAVENDDLNFEKASSEDYQRFLDFYGEGSNSTRKEILSLEVKKRERQRKDDYLAYYAERLMQVSNKTSLECRVSFRMKSAGNAVIQLSYVVPNASWSPLYDGRLLYKERQFELVSYAEITQMTGEDWNDIRLDLSTASPVTGAHLPEPEPWYINFYEPPPPPPRASSMMKSRISKKAVKEEAYPEEEDYEVDEMMDEAAVMPEASMDMEREVSEVTEETFTASKVKSTGLNVTFTSGASQKIPTDGTAKKVFISMERFPVEYEYIIMPAVQEA
ncbi:MAG: mucoidy inhibitor MuiA family protein, partial [bacterium]|nr:mucoidy inhibitor MuiA family protein [bacterium]